MTKKFRLEVMGEHFRLKGQGPGLWGFTAVRFVEAADAAAACRAVVGLLRRQLGAEIEETRGDSPTLYVDDVKELETYDFRSEAGQGFRWFAIRDTVAPARKRAFAFKEAY